MPFRHSFLFAFTLLLTALGAGAPARAQQILVIVNGDPITSYDVTQRQRLFEVSERKTINPKQALDDLIEERIKIQQALRLKIDVDKEEIDRIYATMAKGRGLTPQEMSETLKRVGLDDRIFKQRLVANYVWDQYVRSRSVTVNVRDAEVFAALQKRGETQLVSTEYTLVPIIFTVPRNSNAHGARLQEATGVRGRFTDCEAGIAMVKGMKEVVVRQPVSRLSSEMPAQLRQILDKTEIGRLTPPEVGQSGVETFAMCGKREVRGESSQKREIKDEIATAQFAAESKRFMNDLKKQSLIEYRR
ncbi:peptidylprolyl isomerase [Xanthobacter dioxanivorans]|uniref:Peptidylprolyl isomerase n=1 Tax=Xanthobacter dioxanivorans TaxID=2528964 RepID=A0A974SL39_9HYPH|nr:peptidylprolyl isomerase [Xanthobacter dioxanivorans]QRG08889.1 peptidylprolyl isomerase [Xanthobacter dioxanivorans]